MAEHAWRRSVGGLILPEPVSGHPALELVNSFAGWDGPTAVEYLTTYGHLVVLAADVGLIDPAEATALGESAAADPEGARRALAHAHQVRSLVHAALTGPADAEALDALGRAARRGAATATLVPGDPPTWRVVGRGPDDLEHPADAFAVAAADLATRTEAQRVRTCPGDGCGWAFVDVSGRRRWCSMAWCGNRSKVRAHARRTRDRQH